MPKPPRDRSAELEPNRLRARARRAAREAAGECLTCGTFIGASPFVTCADCRKANADYSRARRKADPPDADALAREAARQRDRKARLRAAGLCVLCGQSEPDAGRVTCSPCRRAENRRVSAWKRRTGKLPMLAAQANAKRAKRIGAGLCECCGRSRPDPGVQKCADCRRLASERNRRYKARKRAEREAARSAPTPTPTPPVEAAPRALCATIPTRPDPNIDPPRERR